MPCRGMLIASTARLELLPTSLARQAFGIAQTALQESIPCPGPACVKTAPVAPSSMQQKLGPPSVIALYVEQESFLHLGLLYVQHAHLENIRKT